MCRLTLSTLSPFLSYTSSEQPSHLQVVTGRVPDLPVRGGFFRSVVSKLAGLFRRSSSRPEQEQKPGHVVAPGADRPAQTTLDSAEPEPSPGGGVSTSAPERASGQPLRWRSPFSEGITTSVSSTGQRARGSPSSFPAFLFQEPREPAQLSFAQGALWPGVSVRDGQLHRFERARDDAFQTVAKVYNLNDFGKSLARDRRLLDIVSVP